MNRVFTALRTAPCSSHGVFILVIAEALRLTERPGAIITRAEIDRAAEDWINRPRKQAQDRRMLSFTGHALRWLTFLGRLETLIVQSPYADHVARFTDYLLQERGLSSRTIEYCRRTLHQFLGEVDGIEADAISDEDLAVAQFCQTGLRDRGVMPNDDGVGAVDLLVEIDIAGTQEMLHLSNLADHTPFNCRFGIVLRRSSPVDDGDQRHLWPLFSDFGDQVDKKRTGDPGACHGETESVSLDTDCHRLH